MRLSRFKQSKSVELAVDMNSLEEYRTQVTRVSGCAGINGLSLTVMGIGMCTLSDSIPPRFLWCARIAVKYTYTGGGRNRNTSMKGIGHHSALLVKTKGMSF